MKKAIILIFIFIILISVPLLTFRTPEFKGLITKNFEQLEDETPAPEEIVNKKSPTSNTNSINEENSETQNSANQQDCSSTQISYALKNLAVNEVCNYFQQQICTEKTVSCSLEAQNLDSEVSGEFTINFNFINEQKTILALKQQTEYVEANSIKVFSVEQTFNSPEASQKISCTFNTLKVPRRENCA